ncbi:MAG: HAD family hydrolase [Candidatus Obscuribacterales bacterium]|nr:HAD family hydrolase [Candidatus Obscuribacterales bacterium]
MSADGILLDLDHTLYDYYAAHEIAMDAGLRLFALRVERDREDVQATFAKARKEIHVELAGQASSHSRFLYFQRSMEILGLRPSSVVSECEERYWSTFLESMVLRPGALRFLESVQHLPIAIVTDLNASIQFRKLKELNLDGYFQAIVTSEEAGVEKPHPRIFEKALAKLHVCAESAYMIGDDFKKDIRGAVSMGIRAYWLNSGQAGPEAMSATDGRDLVVEFGTFDELIELLGATKSGGRA